MDLPMWVFYLSLAAMFIGVLGILLPIVPGVGFIWIVILAYAIAEKFAAIDPITFFFLTVLGAIGFTADLWMTQLGAKTRGASIWSLLAGLGLGVVGAAIGSLFFGVGLVPGAILGALAGIVLAEYHQHEDWDRAIKAGGGWLMGCLLSGGVQMIIAILMILIFVWQVLRG
jgi:hypothetical protein